MLLMSMVCGWVSERLSRTSSVMACITILKPRSLVAWSPISLIPAYEPPAWTRVTSLVFCAQTVGNPPTPCVATTAPPAAAPLRRVRRLNLFLGSEELRVICHLFRRRSQAGSQNKSQKTCHARIVWRWRCDGACTDPKLSDVALRLTFL